jgi:hypothetical protein
VLPKSVNSVYGVPASAGKASDRAIWLGILCALVMTTAVCASTNVVRGADEIYWVPTLEQALEMSQATGKPLFLMGYSLVGDGSTYTKIAEDYCTGVF